MTRRVVTNAQVPHLWAHQTQSDARTGNGNLSFSGTVLFSYSTPIANLVHDKKGKTVALISETGYSSTTGQHISAARSACGYGDAKYLDSFTVPFIGATGGRAPYIGDRYGSSRATDPAEFHPANVQALLAQYGKALDSAMRRLSAGYGHESEHAANFVQRARDYAERFLKHDQRRKIKFPDVAADWSKVEAKRAARMTPEAIAKREKESERRRNREARNYREARGKYGIDYREPYRRYGQSSPFSDEDNAARAETLRTYWARYVSENREQFATQWNWNPACDHAQFSDEDRAARREAERQHWLGYVNANRELFRTDPRFYPQCNESTFSDEDRALRAAMLQRVRAEQEAERVKRDAEKIESWLRGEQVTYLSRGDSALLRIRGDEIETSWGARFPVEHGKLAFRLIARVRQSGTEYQRNGHTVHLGHYAIDRVTSDGTVYAGCHIVKWPAIERVALALGLSLGLQLVSNC